jgi:hypothetical protein
MAKFKTCINGHNYDAGMHDKCPYCPENVSDTDYEKTLIDFKKTQIMDEENQLGKTMISEEITDFKKTPGGASQHPFKRTTIAGSEEKMPEKNPTGKRRLIGWVVTFSHDEFGQDYRLFVGKNRIGSSANNDIVIHDSSVSGEHATILFRGDELLVKDHFSTNGTRINDQLVDEGKLKDGDEIKLGNTLFKIKTVY